MLRLVYTKRQRWVYTGIMWHSFHRNQWKQIESLQNRVANRFGATPLISMRALALTLGLNGHFRGDIYRPHPKNDGKLCFHRRLSVHICGEGTPSSWWGVPHPRSGWGYHILGLDGGTPSQVQMMGTPTCWQGFLATCRVVCLLRLRRMTFLLLKGSTASAQITNHKSINI